VGVHVVLSWALKYGHEVLLSLVRSNDPEIHILETCSPQPRGHGLGRLRGAGCFGGVHLDHLDQLAQDPAGQLAMLLLRRLRV
jgi:hypothetical protein